MRTNKQTRKGETENEREQTSKARDRQREMEVRAEWSIADEACEGGVQRHEHVSTPDTLPECFALLKKQSNKFLTEWMKKKKQAIEEIDVLEEKIPDDDDEDALDMMPGAKKQKT